MRIISISQIRWKFVLKYKHPNVTITYMQIMSSWGWNYTNASLVRERLKSYPWASEISRSWPVTVLDSINLEDETTQMCMHSIHQVSNWELINRSCNFSRFDIQCDISWDRINVCMRLLVSPAKFRTSIISDVFGGPELFKFSLSLNYEISNIYQMVLTRGPLISEILHPNCTRSINVWGLPYM